MTDPLDLDELRQGAEAAGIAWELSIEDDEMFIVYPDENVAQAFGIDEAVHISNMDPPTTIAVLNRLETAKAALREIAEKVCIGGHTNEPCRLNDDGDPQTYCLVHIARAALPDDDHHST